ncbi:DUF418 domain-containing protein [Marinicella sp. S1101]|uniref:DUF418 domain-containing protein n=1 Tax=Marinicella marina TaxID=2996016 RepID=UPI002260E44F|nr:DUF418 domain-containing protein [Marinicella marina]MCX7555129.1 DUF418 domain-containing protein [Marinicella marina]MDJ1140338.1 DUF418 domain-containing protein [Marinicella marina]
MSSTDISDAQLMPTVKQRFDILDALRGFALFGICLANIAVFSGWVTVPAAVKENIAYADYYDFFIAMAIDGRFYTIFSFLFGMGFALQLERLTQATGKTSIYLRRLFFLLLIGLGHIFLLWSGDILALYAVMGFCLFLLRGLKDRAVLVLAMLLLLLPMLGYALFWQLGLDPDAGFYERSSRALGGDGSLPYFFQGFALNQSTTTWSVFYDTQMGLSHFRVGYLIESWRIPKVLGIMLIGMWAGRQLMQGQLVENTGLQKRTLIIGMIVGIPASIWLWSLGGLSIFSAHSMTGFLSVLAYTLGVFPMAFAYVAAFALLWHKAPQVLSVFAAPGRMALTNYLSQTIICIVIFYGLGFGLGIKYAPFILIAITLTIIALQTVFSKWWLNRFKFGPAEWVWRCLTYGKRLPISR